MNYLATHTAKAGATTFSFIPGDDAYTIPDFKPGVPRGEAIRQMLASGQEFLCYDGKPMFSDEHPGKDGPVSNQIHGIRDVPWFVMDTSRPTKPMIEMVYPDGTRCYGWGMWQTAIRVTKDITQDSLFEAISVLARMRDTNGRYLGLGVDTIVAMTYPDQLVAQHMMDDVARDFEDAQARGFTSVTAHLDVKVELAGWTP